MSWLRQKALKALWDWRQVASAFPIKSYRKYKQTEEYQQIMPVAPRKLQLKFITFLFVIIWGRSSSSSSFIHVINNNNKILLPQPLIYGSASGGITTAQTAKPINTMPPTMVTVRTEILEATRRPPITAKPVQMQWPRTPPTITPYTS